MPTFTITISDAVAQQMTTRAAGQQQPVETVLADAIERAACQPTQLGWEEARVLECFGRMNAGPSISIPVISLLHHWASVAPGASNQAFVDALERLVSYRFVTAPSGMASTSVSLTDDGYAAMQSV